MNPPPASHHLQILYFAAFPAAPIALVLRYLNLTIFFSSTRNTELSTRLGFFSSHNSRSFAGHETERLYTRNHPIQEIRAVRPALFIELDETCLIHYRYRQSLPNFLSRYANNKHHLLSFQNNNSV